MGKKVKTRGGWETDTHGKRLRSRGFNEDQEIRKWDNNHKDCRARADPSGHRGQEMGVSSSSRVNKGMLGLRRSRN